MAETSRHDAWKSGESYEAYMGRWSRQLAPFFVEWLSPAPGLDWLEVGCGTGALSAAILNRCAPHSLICIDPSDGFLAKARQNVRSDRVEFWTGDAQALQLEAGSRDITVSGLVLNFIPDKTTALAEMKRVTKPGGTVAFYVWDYPGGGLEFLRAFWSAAVSLDRKAEELTEDRRFPYCTPDGLMSLATAAGLANVNCTRLEIPTVFKDFEDYWDPFTMGAGPAPGYCVSLTAEQRQHLREKLQRALRPSKDGSIHLKACAWATYSVNPS